MQVYSSDIWYCEFQVAAEIVSAAEVRANSWKIHTNPPDPSEFIASVLPLGMRSWLFVLPGASYII